jgi:hypothetical protein
MDRAKKDRIYLGNPDAGPLRDQESRAGSRVPGGCPDAVHATYTCGTVWVENRDEKSGALIEFEFYPILRK